MFEIWKWIPHSSAYDTMIISLLSRACMCTGDTGSFFFPFFLFFFRRLSLTHVPLFPYGAALQNTGRMDIRHHYEWLFTKVRPAVASSRAAAIVTHNHFSDDRQSSPCADPKHVLAAGRPPCLWPW